MITSHAAENDTSAALPGAPDLRGDLSDLDVRLLPAGTVVTVDTLNSRYRLILRDDLGRNALIQGGKLFPEDTPARVEGSTLGGSQLRLGWIDVGFPLELSVSGERVVTSRVRSIDVDIPIH